MERSDLLHLLERASPKNWPNRQKNKNVLVLTRKISQKQKKIPCAHAQFKPNKKLQQTTVVPVIHAQNEPPPSKTIILVALLQ